VDHFHHYTLQRGSSQEAVLEAPGGFLEDLVVAPHCHWEDGHLMAPAARAHHSSRCHLVVPLLHSNLLKVVHPMRDSQVVGIQQVGIRAAGNRQVVVGTLRVGSLGSLVEVGRNSQLAVGMCPVAEGHILPLEGTAVVEGPCPWTFCGSALLLLAVSSHSAQLRPSVLNQML